MLGGEHVLYAETNKSTLAKVYTTCLQRVCMPIGGMGKMKWKTEICTTKDRTYPLSTKTDVYSFRPIRTNKSSTDVGIPLLALRLMVFTLLAHRWSGSTSTLINLKWPNLPWHRPRQIPDAFIDITSMISPFCKYKQKHTKVGTPSIPFE